MPLPMTRIILYVRDVALLKAFYQRHFALPVIEEIDGEWAVLGAGAIELALHRAGPAFRHAAAPASTNANAATSNVKLVFTIDADIDAYRDRLARDGVTVRDLKRYDGFPYRMVDGIDPEGNVFQVMQPD
ncbi:MULTISPECIES: VOC family protein [Burkholderia]|uniref:VOC family protein n=2 Tax=Burkholderia cenocepacia TaxID=95486 RepID=A0A1V2XXX8_9BURK|nr:MULTISPECIES: VOC family protein [Burkholderia]ALV58232.1 lactoylglutathione lyase [Burkholderia cenocepacia]AMU08636.1 lactoylglutathione lyase [Burkholderia cenocepacia]AMU12620.1 lactoylglutathione lyase [Burkholderia cenocepacia]AOK39209.1 lactoylglutathione lyase [Burkholderia cenocepacia]AQQ21873.1 lactoylglutathione lyase [Burkholderia cenocepacia]